MLDLECVIVELTGWSLVDIDNTDLDSLIPFIFRFPVWKAEQAKKRPTPAAPVLAGKDANQLDQYL